LSIKRLKNDNETLRKTLKHREKEVRDAQSELESKHNILVLTQRDSHGKTTEIQAQRDQIAQAVLKLDAESNKLRELREENALQRQNLSNLAEKIRNSDLQIGYLKTTIGNLEVTAQNAGKEAEKLNIEIRRLEEENEELEAELEEARDNLSNALKLAADAARWRRAGTLGSKRGRTEEHGSPTAQAGTLSKRARQREPTLEEICEGSGY